MYLWITRKDKVDWTKEAPLSSYPVCPTGSTDVHLVFGGSGLLGRYITHTWKRDFPKVCLVNYSRRPCKECDVNIRGDVRDSEHIERMINNYDISTVILSVKPDMTFVKWKTYMEINYSAIAEIMNILKASKIKKVLYVSSIAASSHFLTHHLSTEDSPESMPRYTDYEAAYDLSKRMGEDVVLAANSKSLRTVALRVSGILGGEGDPFFHHRLPIVSSFNNPIIVDYGYAGNIADALAEISRVLDTSSGSKAAGQFFYYTGEHVLESMVAQHLSKITGRPLLALPTWTLDLILKVYNWIRLDFDYYTLIDLIHLACVEQTFDQSKFHNTFPKFKAKYSVLQGFDAMYGPQKNHLGTP